jgi:hypothetical protein
MCFWREGDRCYNEKIAYIDTTPYQIDGITYTRNGELIETAIIKCCKYSVLKTREKKLKRIINN